MNKNSNTYTFIYAAVMVIIVAAVLATASYNLKSAQNANIANEKKMDILRSVNITSTSEDVASEFKTKIVEQYIINTKGEKVDGTAFDVNLKVERSKKDESQILLPVYVADLGKEGKKYILPLYGTGLWGPIWGYISLDEDMTTIYGATFAHKGETPGLGAEIATPAFQKPFTGKTIFDKEGKFTSITVAKAGEIAPEAHKVDAISGGTITSKALQKMLLDDLSMYKNFLNKNK